MCSCSLFLDFSWTSTVAQLLIDISSLPSMTSSEVSRPPGQDSIPSTESKDHNSLEFTQGDTKGEKASISKDGAIASTLSDSDEDGTYFKKNPFLDPDVAEHWAEVYENSNYECRAYFDPTATWTEEEERKIVRRLDWRVCLWAVSDILQYHPNTECVTNGYTVCHVLWPTSGSWKLVTSRI